VFIVNIQNITAFPVISPKKPSKESVDNGDRKSSQYLPKGAQGQLIDAALLAETIGANINRLTTIRTEVLQVIGSGIFAGVHEADAIKILLELMRHWHKERGIPWACIWAREVGEIVGGHLHIGTHLTDAYNDDYNTQVALWTGENQIYLPKHKPEEIGISEHQNWLVKCCLREGRSGPDVGAYLGKDVPTWTQTGWGKDKYNEDKRVFKHKCLGGHVEGTSRAVYRHGTSRNISPNSVAGRKVLATISDANRLIQDSLIRNVGALPY
jgi:hypothetical protein